jgi:DNA-binding MarR family transcriptional regulator
MFLSFGYLNIFMGRFDHKPKKLTERQMDYYKFIVENPDSGLRDIMKGLGTKNGTTVYTLGRLEWMGYISSDVTGSSRVYNKIGKVPDNF